MDRLDSTPARAPSRPVVVNNSGFLLLVERERHPKDAQGCPRMPKDAQADIAGPSPLRATERGAL